MADALEKHTFPRDDGSISLEHFAALQTAPTFLPLRFRPGGIGTWSGHLPFAYDLVRSTRPSLFVELGTHYGESYFAFCQSVAQNGTGTLCYAVDHWRGDEHAGYYNDDVYNEVRAYNDRYYSGFSHLLRSSFDNALPQFSDDSIDLLHIDGLHTYDAVASDFEKWLPRVRPGGLVLLHDVAVRHANFGVWKLWEQIERTYEETFSFHHSWGLGVLRKPGGGAPQSALTEMLFRRRTDAAVIRRYYVLQATSCAYAAAEEASGTTKQQSGTDSVQIFPFGDDGYNESTSYIEPIDLNERHTIHASFPHGLGSGPLRIDICGGPGYARIWQIAIIDEQTGNILWSAGDPAHIAALRTAGDVVAIPAPAYAVFASYGPDPQVFVDPIPERALSCAAVVHLSISVSGEIREDLQHILARMRELMADRNSAEIAQRDQHQLMDQEVRGLRDRAAALERDLAQAQQQISGHAAERGRANSERDAALRAAAQLRTEVENLRRESAALTAERERRIALEASLSWRITKPVRALGSVFMKP